MSVVDVERVRRALAELDRLAALHPERLGEGPHWRDQCEDLRNRLDTADNEGVESPCRDVSEDVVMAVLEALLARL